MSADAAPAAGRRLLLISPALPPDPYTGAARAGRFHAYLPRHGFEVDVIAEGPMNDGSGGVWRIPRTSECRLAPWLWRLARALRRVLPHDDQLPWAANAAGLARRLFAHNRYTAVISTAPPMGVHVAALFLKHRYGVPCICDFRDPLVGNPFREKERFFPHDALLERWICARADAVVCNTDAVAEQWRARYPRHAGKVHLIWNGFDPAEEIAVPASAPSGAPLVIAHVGALYGGRHPGVLLDSFLRCLGRGQIQPGDLKIRLAGPLLPECEAAIQRQVTELLHHGCIQVDNRWVPPAEAAAVSASAGASLVVDLNEQCSSLQVPAKLFQSIRQGKPVLALTYRDSPCERILRQSGVAHECIDPRSPAEEIDGRFLSFLRLPRNPQSPSEWFTNTFDGSRQAAELARIIVESTRAKS